MSEQKNPGELETWAIVEVFGHSKYAGFCRQVPMGGAAMIRVDVPALQERQENYLDYEGVDGEYKRVQKTRTIPAVPAYTKFLGISAVFSVTPCTEELCRAAVESFRSPPVSILVMPAQRALPSSDSAEYEDQKDNDR